MWLWFEAPHEGKKNILILIFAFSFNEWRYTDIIFIHISLHLLGSDFENTSMSAKFLEKTHTGNSQIFCNNSMWQSLNRLNILIMNRTNYIIMYINVLLLITIFMFWYWYALQIIKKLKVSSQLLAVRVKFK